ncbi:YHS domain-containing protein [bacterium]|nr:MAG: YHS domain-containing protein [bacterium]
MKTTMILAALVAVSGAAFAQSPTKPTPKRTPAKTAPAKAMCSVMHNDPVDIAKATKDGLFTDYKGKRYYFCCPACKPTFEKDPAKYAKTAKGFPIPAKKTA